MLQNLCVKRREELTRRVGKKRENIFLSITSHVSFKIRGLKAIDCSGLLKIYILCLPYVIDQVNNYTVVMSNFNFTNPIHACQKGFLLLEALVTLCALSMLLLGLASWYSHAVTSQRCIYDRLQALSVASSFIANYQSMRTIPAAGKFTHAGYKLHCFVQQDAQQPDFYWFKVTVKHTDEKTLAELVSGIHVAGAAS